MVSVPAWAHAGPCSDDEFLRPAKITGSLEAHGLNSFVPMPLILDTHAADETQKSS